MKKAFTAVLSIVLVMMFVITSVGFTSINVTGIKLDSSKITLKVGQTSTLNVTITPSDASDKNLTFSSGNTKIATVDKDGKITAIKDGKTTITVVSSSNKKISAKCNITVTRKLKTLKITWLGFGPGPSLIPADGNPTEKLIEEKFDVDIKPVPVDVFNNDKLTLYFAEGNPADCMVIFTKNYQDLAKEGFIRSFPKEMLYKYMPRTMAAVEEYYGAGITKRDLTFQGKCWYTPYFWIDPSYIMVARKDWMENVGIKSAPATLDEFYQMIKKFTKNDPDGNGKDDTYGYHPGYQNIKNFCFDYIFGAYGLTPDSWYMKNGQAVYASATLEYKEALKTIVKYKKEGLIDPGYATEDRNKQWDKWANGSIGSMIISAQWAYPTAEAAPNQPCTVLKKNNPAAEWVYFPPFKGPDGKSGHFAYAQSPSAWTYCFGKKASDEKVKRCMQIKEALTTDLDFYMTVYYGPEGVGYTRGENGAYVIKSVGTSAKARELGVGNFYGDTVHSIANTKKLMDPRNVSIFEMALNATVYATGNSLTLKQNDAAYKTEIAEVNKKLGDINAKADSFYQKALKGEINIDSAWDAYMKDLKNAGLDYVTGIYTKRLVK